MLILKHTFNVIGHVHTDFPTKFGIPRQSGLVEELMGKIVFLPKYSREEAFRGLEGYSHIWIIWQFSEAVRDDWSPTVRPPRLGGNKRVGVFSTRSPYRPNPIGLSCVKLLGIKKNANGCIELTISGADILDGTPIYDIKPYLPFADSIPEAIGGFADKKLKYCLNVVCDGKLLSYIPENKRSGLIKLLSEDPRPSYQEDPNRVYGFFFGDFEVSFTVSEGTLTVKDIRHISTIAK